MTSSYMPPPLLIIAVDGPSASGKGTLARRLAEHLGWAYLDTGLLYRAVGMRVLAEGGSPEDSAGAERAAHALAIASDLAEILQDPALKGEKAGQAASRVAVFPGVRAALLDLQRTFAQNPPNGCPGAVLDGRDIGTVVVPEAPVKLYITARPEIRAFRRFRELQGRGEHVTEAATLADLQARDARDERRASAPSRPAPDAVVLETSSLTADEAFAQARTLVEGKLKRF